MSFGLFDHSAGIARTLRSIQLHKTDMVDHNNAALSNHPSNPSMVVGDLECVHGGTVIRQKLFQPRLTTSTVNHGRAFYLFLGQGPNAGELGRANEGLVPPSL